MIKIAIRIFFSAIVLCGLILFVGLMLMAWTAPLGVGP